MLDPPIRRPPPGRGAAITTLAIGLVMGCYPVPYYGGPPVVDHERAPGTPTLTLELTPVKRLEFSWGDVATATDYRLYERPPDASSFQLLADQLFTGSHVLTAPLHRWRGAQYRLEVCNEFGCTASDVVELTGTLADAVGLFKSSEVAAGDRFGSSLALSEDGSLVVVGSLEGDECRGVQVFARDFDAWVAEPCLAGPGDGVQRALALSRNGGVLAVGGGDGRAIWIHVRVVDGWWAPTEVVLDGELGVVSELALSGDGGVLAAAVGEGGCGPGDDEGLGAVFVLERAEFDWSVRDCVTTAAYPPMLTARGPSLALSRDGDTLVIGDYLAGWADLEAGLATVLTRSGDAWVADVEFEAPDPAEFGRFAFGVALSDNGDTLALGSSAGDTVSVYRRDDDGVWGAPVAVQAESTEPGDRFGAGLAMTGDGRTLIVGAPGEWGSSVALGGDPGSNTAADIGAVYLFALGPGPWPNGEGVWEEQSYVKASNPGAGDEFGLAVAVSNDGETLAVAAPGEDSRDVPGDNDDEDAGAVYVY